MTKFSERYKYSVPDVVVREGLTPAITNSIINYYLAIKNDYPYEYSDVIRNVWLYFLNNRLDLLDSHLYHYPNPIVDFISSVKRAWYEKMDIIEFTNSLFVEAIGDDFHVYNDFLNSEFERHKFAYRLIAGNIVEITSEVEVESIIEASNNKYNEVRIHIESALNSISASNTDPDYRNSIKESISAVECFCRIVTKKNTLGEALSALEKSGISIQSQLKDGLIKIYAYTNNKATGIRHALIEGDYCPTYDEAIFMLVSCSAFVNYLTKLYGNGESN